MSSSRPPGHAEAPKRNIAFKDFAGVNTQADRTAIGENEFSWLENLIPVGHANLRALPGPSGILATTSAAIISWQYVNINNTDLILVFLSNGAGYQYNLNATLISMGGPGTFTGTPRAAQWKDERAVIIATNGYWSWDGSTLTVLQGEVVGLTITQSGSGYTSRPSIAISGTGTGATATAIVGSVAASLTAAGTGYAVGDVLNISGGTSTTSAQFQVSTVGGGGAITGFAIKTAGDYTATPANPASVTGGLGSGATFTITWGVVGATITAAGSGYTGTPTAAFSGGAGSGAAATVLLSSAPSGGVDIASYAGRIWVANGRTITYSAPGSYTDFTVASAGGAFIITDESFHSVITSMAANNNYLYIFGTNAVQIISNVTVASSGVTAGQTSFSNNNITGAVGTGFPASLVLFDRSVLFADSYGFHGVFGATVKKASDKIDGTFPFIDTTKPISGGLALMFNNIVPCFLFQYFDPTNSGVSRPLIACLRNGEWFFASQGTALKLVCGAYIGDAPALFATDGTNIYRLFQDNTATISTAAQTGLRPMEEPWTTKQSLKLGIELTSSVYLQGTAIMQTETGQSSSIGQSNVFVFTNSSGETVQFFNGSADLVNFFVGGRQVFQGDVQTYGRYLGVSWTSTSPNYTLNGILYQFKEGAQWGSLPNSG